MDLEIRRQQYCRETTTNFPLRYAYRPEWRNQLKGLMTALSDTV